ncbi:heparinase II/III family protein [Tsuneonella sp. HG094]
MATVEKVRAKGASDARPSESLALPLRKGGELHALTATGDEPGEVLEAGRALAIADFAPPSLGAGEALIRLAYRMGVSGSTLSRPFGKAAKPRLLGTVESPLTGERAAGVALRAGHFFVHGVKAPIAQMDFQPVAKLTPPFERTVHGFTWLRDLAACAPREQCTATAERVLSSWLEVNRKPGKGAAWQVENAGQRLLMWLVHAPLILSGDGKLRARALAAMGETARWLDRNVTKAPDRLGEVAGWTAIVAAGLLLPDGKPRRLFGEAGLVRALGELVADDGGTLSRSPLAQMSAIAMLTDLKACYRAVRRDPPQALETMLAMLVPPLLGLTHGDGGLGSWQGAGAVTAERVSALVSASGVRTRPLKEARQWGYQRATGGKAVLQFDAAPPPLAKHARAGCASTLAFEFSHGPQRLVVNCGGAAFAGGQVPVRIEQGLRATAAHSTLALDDANSTAVLLHGKLGAGVGEVEVDRRVMPLGNGTATRLEASHDGYASRHGLIHRRILILRDDGSELRGEDLLVPSGKSAKRGKIGFALRFHVGPGIELGLSEDKRGAGLALPDGSYWQFRLGQAAEGVELSIEESLWVDGQGRPQPIEQIVIQGLTPRSGGSFAWLLKKMG